MNQQTPLNSHTHDCNGQVDFLRKIITHHTITSLRKRAGRVLLVFSFIMLGSSLGSLWAQSSTCVPGMVGNSSSSPWSEECYLNNSCGLQGNPCQAGDVSLLGVFIADEMGGPVPACNVGEEVEVLLWGTFNNSTNSARYAVRTRTEIFINGVFLVELIGCSFDVMAPGATDVALLGTFTYTCGDQVQLVNTWIGWDTNQAQCSDSGAPNYDNVCGEYPPSKCSRDFDTINFLTPNFDYFCGLITTTTTEVCFTNATIGGTPPYTYFWEFGDGGTSTLENPCHTFVGTTGSYTVTLTVTDADSTQAGAVLEVDLDSLDCCDMTVICPPTDGGLFSCIEDIPAADTDLVTVTDSCGPVVITFDDDITGTGCGTDTMFVVRSYFITDGSNFDTCVQTFAAVDDVGPQIMGCPGDITVECANLVPVPSLDGIDAEDNCTGNIFLSVLPDVVSDSTCANRYVITRTYVATDACDNTSTCEQLITVFDDTDPEFTFVPLDTSILCDADTVFGVPAVMDNCGGAVTLDSVTNFFPTVTCAGGSIVRTWTATDACGNTSSADQAIFLIDTLDPVFIFEPADTSIVCDETPVFGTPVVEDNCDVDVTVTSEVFTAPTVNCAGGTTTIVWTAMDDCGNTATASQVITFIDTLDPVFTFIPNDSTIACGETPVFGVPIVTDNCDTQVSVTADTVTLTGLCGDTSIVTWTATDNCNNTSTAQQTIFEVDLLAPSITCPPDATLECNVPTDPNTSIPGEATAEDNCDATPTVTFSDVTVASLTCAVGYTITRTWTATDDCGNSTACIQMIEVVDTTPPALTCPIDITIECTDPIIPDSTGLPVVVDNCDTTPTVTFIDVTFEGICPQAYLIERTWIAVDTCGNDTSCVQLISVVDTTAPVIICPADTIVDCTAAVDTASLGVAMATDNCGGTVTISFNDSILPGGCEQEYTINRTWLAVDECLNRTTCLQVIMVQDTVRPVIDTTLCPTTYDFYTSEGSTCPAESVPSILLNVAFGIPIAVDETWTVGNNVIPGFEGCLTDNCADPDSFYILPSSFFTSGDSCDLSFHIGFSIQDNCGNSLGADIQITVTIHDDVAPVITCPENITVECDDSTSPDSTGYATAVDECIGLVGITFADSTAAGSCPNEMIIFRTWTADDSCGNTSSCVQLIFVEDNTGPMLTCPDNITVECTDSTEPDSTGFPTVVDNCDLTPEVSFVDATVAGNCPSEYSIIRSWTAIDTCGNISTCVQNIFVEDNTAPEITCPDNLTIECDDSTLPDSTGVAIATDNCDPTPEVTYLDTTVEGGCPQAYQIIRVWTAMDTCGNINTCTQLISVVDTTGPVLTCPPDATLDCDVPTGPNSTVPGMATATDNCDPAPLVTSSDVTAAGSCPQEYTITRTWLATDACLNTSTCVQIITVQDTLAPVITCPADTLIDCSSGTLPGITGRATAIDNCDPSVLPTFDDSISTGSCPQEYTITRTWTATDSCLNVSTCVQIIMVQDTSAPMIICPADTIIDCTASTLAESTGLATATDNCDTLVEPTFVDVIIQGLCPQGYTIERTWTAVDDCLNESTCLQIISVQDTVAPLIVCPADTIIDCTASSSPDDLGFAIATDNCDTMVLVNSVDVIVPSTVCPSAYTILRTWTAVDDCLNRTTCLQTIIVQDTTAPIIVCPADTIVDCDADVSPDLLGFATATDNCTDTITPTFVDEIVAGQCPQEYTIMRTWTATDSCFNFSTCVQIISVQDTVAPVIVCPVDTIIDCTANSSPDVLGSATATDNCDAAVLTTFVDATIAGDCPQEYTIERTWTATDSCFNLSTCIQIISVQDTLAPVITCPADTIIDCTSITLPEATGVASASDNCDTLVTPTFADVTIAGDCAQEYTIERTWTAVDDCLNESTCLQIISVQDTAAPLIVCPADTIIDCTASSSPDDLGFAIATDNCDTMVLVNSVDVIVPSTVCPSAYTILRTWTAVDDCLNRTTCLQTIIVQDTTAPIIVCPADTIVDCDADVSPDLLGFATATDNCTDTITPTFVDEIVAGQCPQEYTIMRTWTATDSCFNFSTCVQIISVQDTVAPVIVCPVDTIIDCTANSSPDVLGSATATDNCDAAVLTTFVDATIAGECPQEYTIERTWTATDSCFNSSTCIQIISVQDTLAPVITCPADTIIDCTSITLPEATGSASASDNCDTLVTPTFADVTIAGDCAQEYTIERTWTAVDDCLNESTCLQIISVQDTTMPVVLCPSDTIVDCTESLDPSNLGFATATDNCDTLVEPTYQDTILAQICPDNYILLRIWTAVDDCGNESTCPQLIIVQDTVGPILVCPADTIVDCNTDTSPEVLGFATATDNCTDSIAPSFTDAIIPGQCPNSYAIQRIWIANDSCNNFSTCVQTIIVQDTTAPVIVCPADTIIDCTADSSPDLLGSATATDNCDLAVLTTFVDATVAGECPQEYTIMRTWTATDSCFNSSTCIQLIMVQDTVAPVITCPADTVIDCTANTLPSSATATDNCDTEVVPTFTDVTIAGDCPQEYTIERTWIATDDCLNESTCLQIISVQDTLAPVITCPADLTLQCSDLIPETAATATDSCGEVTIPAYTEIICDNPVQGFTGDYALNNWDFVLNNGGVVAPMGDQQILLASPNVGLCNGAVVLMSIEVPNTGSISFNWSFNTTDINGPGFDPFGYSINGTFFQLSDDSGPDMQSGQVTVSVAAGDVFAFEQRSLDCTNGSGATTLVGFLACTEDEDVCTTLILRTHTAIDECGNESSCIQTILLIDTIAPVITCPADTIIDCSEDTSPVNLGVATAVDNCDTLAEISSVDVIIPSTVCVNGYTILRRWAAIDNCGNLITCLQTITVQDTTAPVITCPADTIIDCTASISPDSLGVAVAIDACDGPVLTTFLDATMAGECPQEYIITRTWIATDSCFNSSSCLQTITVQDTTAPVIICPADTIIDCTGNTSPDVLGVPDVTDNCDPEPLFDNVDVTIAGECPQEYTIERTWTATDACGNSSTCLQIITIQDTVPPAITCPLNVTIECTDSIEPDSTGGPALAADLCDPTPEVTFSDATVAGECPQEYTITRTWVATDSCGNSSSCDQLIFVQDNTPPAITCPANLTIDCDANTLPDSTGFATAIDNCDEDPEVTYQDAITGSQTCVQEYIINRLWIATDSCGNASSCTQVIFVQDTTPPVATFIPPDITVECDTLLEAILAEPPVFDDNCDTLVEPFASIEVVQNEGCPYTNTYIIGWSGVDDCGNQTIVTRTVVEVDTTAPVVICPPDVTLDCLDDTSTETNGFAEVTDNCDPEPIVTSADVTIAGECPQEYTIERTWTASDACGNSSTCLQILTVVDTVPPAIICPADLIFECVSEVPEPNTEGVIASDSCGGVTITFVEDIVTDSTCVNSLIINRVYQAEDDCGNISTCTQIIDVFDDTPPTLLCPPGVTVQCASEVPAPSTLTLIASDNCEGEITIAHVNDVTINMTCINRFDVVRTYSATDACGNSSTCTQTITVFDNTPPVITCPANLTVQCASQVPAPNIAGVTVTDNCAGTSTVVFVNDVISNMTCVNRFTVTRTYRATDACGNSATCAQIITVFDNTPPMITCPANITVQCAAQVPPPNIAQVTVTDNCAGTNTVAHVSDVITNMTCINRFTLTRTYRATDACGNSATCTQVITVFDNTAPTITFNDPLLEGVPNGGTVEVQCFGQDPNWTIPTFGPGDVIATDNCAGNVTVVLTDDLVDEGDCDVDGYINRYRFTWTATDACGNSSTAFVFMNLIDTIPPVIHGIPEDITVNCDEIPAPPTDITATDECLCACLVEFEESDPAPGCQNGQVITRTWIAKDDCGNMTIEVQNITLVDEEGPEIVVIFPGLEGVENGTIFEYTCNEGGIPEFWDDLNAESVTTIFSCGTAGIVSFDPTIHIANNCKFWGYVENRNYQWEAIDQCGNISTFTIIVRLIDTEGPQFINIPEMTCVDDPALDLVDIVDNCENAKFTYWDTKIPNPCGEGEALRRTYEAWDDCGNYSRDTVILIPNDKIRPIMEFVNQDLIDIGFGEVLIVECSLAELGQYTPYGPDDVTVTDGCMEELEVVYTERIIESGDCNDGVLAVMQLVWMAQDICGNRTELVINAHLVDHTAPDLVDFEVDVTIDCNDEMPELFAVDNCGEVTITTVDSVIAGACEFEYDVLRRITVSDPCGNTTERLQIVRVGDGQGPDIQGVEEELCDDLSIPEVTAYDPCAGEFVGVTMQEDTLDVPCRDGFVVERIWTAVDACGNVSEVRQLIIVGDQTAPEILIPSGSVIRLFDFFGPNHVDMSETNTFKRLQALDDNSVYAKDDCDQEITPVLTLDVTISDNCEEDGYYEHRVYTWVVEDACGNSDSFSFEVDVMDDIPPVLSTIPEDTIVVCDDLPAPPVITAEDYADDVTVTYEELQFPGDGPGVFVVTRTWTATDPCGNVSQASQNIQWIPTTLIACDILMPEFVDCNSHGVVIGSGVSGGLGEITYMWEITGEKCFIQSGQNTPEITIYVGFSEVEISLTVTDAFGCSNVCTATLDCLDPIVADFNAEQDPTVPFVVEGPTVQNSNDLLDILKHFNMWPNPASASVNISFESTIEHDTRIVLVNYLGQTVYENTVRAIKGFNSHKVNVAHLPEGSYMVQLISEKAMESKMLVLVRNK